MAQPMTPERIKQIEDAFAELQRRGWGFASNGQGFGDPAATFTVVGPLHGGVLVDVLAGDHDAVEAVRKAVEVADAP